MVGGWVNAGAEVLMVLSLASPFFSQPGLHQGLWRQSALVASGWVTQCMLLQGLGADDQEFGTTVGAPESSDGTAVGVPGTTVGDPPSSESDGAIPGGKAYSSSSPPQPRDTAKSVGSTV
jgi:hypothetical protein